MQVLLGIMLTVALSTAAIAEDSTNAVFKVSLRGLTAGTLTVTGTEGGGRYSTNGILKPAGLIGMVSSVTYRAKSSGRLHEGVFSPSRYDEQADTGKRKSRTVMTYSGGVPKVVSGETGDLNPAGQKGTVDPQTAIFAALRDVDEAQMCKLNVQMFDGKRRSQVRLRAPKPEGKFIRCDGEYRRLAGFSAEDMAEKTRFPFNLYYAPVGDGRYRVERVVTQTLFGNATMTRR